MASRRIDRQASFSEILLVSLAGNVLVLLSAELNSWQDGLVKMGKPSDMQSTEYTQFCPTIRIGIK